MILLAKRLKERRIEIGYTQKELGQMIGVTKASISGYENGDRIPSIDTLVDLANALQIEISYLLGVEHFAVAEEKRDFGINISYNEIVLLKELRNHTKLYEQLLEDPERTIKYIEKKLR